ncbi:MAG: AAA family ATPase [Candidatus Omnitrophota bacterium]
MYEEYWSLNAKPFENTPDPRFIYYSKEHEEALLRMMYAIKEEKGAAMLTGIWGSGKTLLSRVIIDELIKNKIYDIALITYPQLTALQFMQEIVYQLGENSSSKDSKPMVLHQLQTKIYKNFKEGKKTVFIVDEAQIIKDEETFEELRLLLNFQLNNKFLLTLVLIGQPELIQKVSNIPQLEQRIGIKFHLEGLSKADTEKYVTHRLSVAGLENNIFTQEAIDIIYDYSEGLPRKINNACDLALLIGFGQEVKQVDKKLVKYVIDDLGKKADNYAKNV